MKMTDIYFRTDGNSRIATGHLMRCLAIARACTRQGARVRFIVSDEESLSLLQERFEIPREFDSCCLNSNYEDLHSEIPTLISYLSADSGAAETAPDTRPWIFIDSYYASTSYFEALREYFRVAYLDDLRSFDCAVDLLINYDTDEDSACYANASRKLLGVQYTPLREQFQTPAYQVRPRAEHILLSTGGTDPYRVAETLLESIYTAQDTPHPLCSTADTVYLRSMHYHILTSRANTRCDALNALAQAHPSIHIHMNVTEVATLMASCDLAVCAGGTTLCELCAVGVPAISCLMAENQRTAVETYAKMNLIPCAGDIRPVNPVPDSDRPGVCHTDTIPASVPASEHMNSCMPNESTLRHILEFLAAMAKDHGARAAVSSSMKSFLDGTGARQIARALLL